MGISLLFITFCLFWFVLQFPFQTSPPPKIPTRLLLVILGAVLFALFLLSGFGVIHLFHVS
jgi:hypothetical protein